MFSEDKTKHKLTKYQTRECNLNRGVKSAQSFQERDPWNLEYTNMVYATEEEIWQLKDKRSLLAYHKQAAQWTQIGDKYATEFCWATRPQRKSTFVKFLKKSNWDIKSELEEMHHIVISFYKDPFSESLMSSSHLNKILGTIHDIVPDEIDSKRQELTRTKRSQDEEDCKISNTWRLRVQEHRRQVLNQNGSILPGHALL
jgi:hypothetical protein